jgi:hypothetical protein
MTLFAFLFLLTVPAIYSVISTQTISSTFSTPCILIQVKIGSINAYNAHQS